jgi:DNA-binding NarL/FixJ family response regulator
LLGPVEGGRTNAEIGEELHISLSTVEFCQELPRAR